MSNLRPSLDPFCLGSLALLLGVSLGPVATMAGPSPKQFGAFRTASPVSAEEERFYLVADEIYALMEDIGFDRMQSLRDLLDEMSEDDRDAILRSHGFERFKNYGDMGYPICLVLLGLKDARMIARSTEFRQLYQELDRDEASIEALGPLKVLGRWRRDRGIGNREYMRFRKLLKGS